MRDLVRQHGQLGVRAVTALERDQPALGPADAQRRAVELPPLDREPELPAGEGLEPRDQRGVRVALDGRRLRRRRWLRLTGDRLDLAAVEDVAVAKRDPALLLAGPLVADAVGPRAKNQDPALAPAHAVAELAPRPQPGYLAGVRALGGDQEEDVRAVAVERLAAQSQARRPALERSEATAWAMCARRRARAASTCSALGRLWGRLASEARHVRSPPRAAPPSTRPSLTSTTWVG